MDLLVANWVVIATVIPYEVFQPKKSTNKMVRESNNIHFGMIADERQMVVLKNNKKTCDNLKRSTEDVSPPNFVERNSGYYERSSRLIADTESSYIKRSNHNSTTSNICQPNNINNSTNKINIQSGNNPDSSGNHHSRGKCYRNSSYGLPSIAAATPAASSVILNDRTGSFGSTNNCYTSRVPFASWSDIVTTCINGTGGLVGTLTAAVTMTASSLSAMTIANSGSSSSSSNLSSTINSNINSLSQSICSIASAVNINSIQRDSQNSNDTLNAALLCDTNVATANTIKGIGNECHSGGNRHNNGNILVNAPVISSASVSASHHALRSLHGRSTTSSSRSHSRSPSSYTSHSSSSSTSSRSSNSHASSPVTHKDVGNITHRVGSRNLQSAVTLPNSGSTSSSYHQMAGGNSGHNNITSTNSTGGSNPTTTSNPVVHSEDNRPLAIRVHNLPARSSDTSLKDGLFHEYKKHGKVTWVKVVGQNAERYALVCFKKPEDVEKALEVSQDKLFFGCKIEVEPYQGYDVEDNEFRPYEAELDEYHPKSTRTLFIGNLEKEITANELRAFFECFGEIIEIDIKKQGTSAYAFCQYSDIVSVVKAMKKMDGEHLGNNRIKLGFGKSMPTNCVWIDGIADKISESHLQSQFSRYGAVCKVVIDRLRQLALVLYEQIQYAQAAVKEMRGATLRGRKLQVDFASRECQDAFYDKIEKQSSGNSRFTRYETHSRSRASSFSRHQNSNDACSPSNTPGSSSNSSIGGGNGSASIGINIPILSSGVIANSTTSGHSIGSLNMAVNQNSGNSTPARCRSSRSSRHTLEYDYIDSRRFRSYDEYSQGSGASHDEEGTSHMGNHLALSGTYTASGLRSDSPLLSRLGPIISNCKESVNDIIEVGLTGRRRCDKSPAKQKNDGRLYKKDRNHLQEQLEECPSSGEESVVSPRKRIKLDHHSINSTNSLLQPHILDEQASHKNSNCDYIVHDAFHRKGEVRRLSESNNTGNRYQQLNHHHHHAHHLLSHHHHHQQQQHQHQHHLGRRPSTDILTTVCGSGSNNIVGRHGSISSTSSNSDNLPLTSHQTSVSKRRRVCGTSNSLALANTMLTGGVNLSTSISEDYHHITTSRGRGHQLHSQHSHDASSESADGSRPGTPLCDERPEVVPSEPRRIPRDKPREPIILPLPKFGIQFFQQYRKRSISPNITPSITSINYHNFHNNTCAVGDSTGLATSVLNSVGDGESGNNNNHSSLSYNSIPTTSISSSLSSSSISKRGLLPNTSHKSNSASSSTRYTIHWRTHHHHHHHHSHHQTHGQPNSHTGAYGNCSMATTTSASQMISPARSRSLSSNSSDSDIPGQSSTGSPSLEERIRTLDEMLERLPGSSGVSSTNNNFGKRHDYNSLNDGDLRHQLHRSIVAFTDYSHSGETNLIGTSSSTSSSRHKFLDIVNVNERQPSEIVKTVLAKKSIFDDDLQRLKRNQWYDPTIDGLPTGSVNALPALPNLAATKTPVVGCSSITSTNSPSSCSTFTKPHSTVSLRVSNPSPMNSPQPSMSPCYKSPSSLPLTAIATTVATAVLHMTKMASSLSTNIINAQSSSINNVTSGTITTTTSSLATKALQYPFPTHPPSSIAESTKCVSHFKDTQSFVPGQVMTKAASLAESASSPSVYNKPKNYLLSKSLSVPNTTQAEPIDSRVQSKPSSVPVSTNVNNRATITTTTTTSISCNVIGISSSSSTSFNNCNNVDKCNKLDMNSSKETKSITLTTVSPHVEAITVSPMQSRATTEDKKLIKNERNVSATNRKTSLSRNDNSADEKCIINGKDSSSDRIKTEQIKSEREKVTVQKQNQKRENLADQEITIEKDRIKKDLSLDHVENMKNKQKDHNFYRVVNGEKQKVEKEKVMSDTDKQKLLKREKRQSLYEDENGGTKVLNEYSRKTTLNTQAKGKNPDSTMQESYHRSNDIERQNNKENSEVTDILSPTDNSTAGTGTAGGTLGGVSKNKCRKATPERHPKRRLSTQENNVGIYGTNNSNNGPYSNNSKDQVKRVRAERMTSSEMHTNNSRKSSVAAAANESQSINKKEAGDLKEFMTNTKNQHQLIQTLSLTNHKGGVNVKQHNSTSSNKCHRNKHLQKENGKSSSTSSIPGTTQINVNPNSSKTTISAPSSASNVHHALSKHEMKTVQSKCSFKSEIEQMSDEDVKLRYGQMQSASDDDNEHCTVIQQAQPTVASVKANSRKHKESHNSGGNGDGSGGHHNRHKSSKREKDHHQHHYREKKKHSVSSTTANAAEEHSPMPNSTTCVLSDDALINSNANRQAERRVFSQGNNEKSSKIKQTVNQSRTTAVEMKGSHSLDDASSNVPHLLSSSRQNQSKHISHNMNRKLLLSSAEDTDDGGSGLPHAAAEDDDDDNSDAALRKTSIFDIPDDGPYISMYDKVKARSCKNMQKQEEEKKIKAKFTQLKQSRAKREEKKCSTSYDGDSDSDFDRADNRIVRRSSTDYKSPANNNCESSSTEDDHDQRQQVNRENVAHNTGISLTKSSIIGNHPCSGSDKELTEMSNSHVKHSTNNSRRLCDDGDETSEDDLIRRNYKTAVSSNKRNIHHHTSRIASDSESQSQSTIDIKLKVESEGDERRNQLFGSQPSSYDHIKEENTEANAQSPILHISGNMGKDDEIKIKRKLSICSSGDGNDRSSLPNIKNENLSQNYIKKEFTSCFDGKYEKVKTEQKYVKPDNLPECSPSEWSKVKKHKKSKKRQKVPICDNFNKNYVNTFSDVKTMNALNINTNTPMSTPLPPIMLAATDAKGLTSQPQPQLQPKSQPPPPTYDVFDELKQNVNLISHNHHASSNNPLTTLLPEKKRHKDRKERKREKLRHLNVDAGSGVVFEKLYEKEKHRLKKSKKSKSIDGIRNNLDNNVRTQSDVNVLDNTQHNKKIGGEKMEDIFGPISDDDDEEEEEEEEGADADIDAESQNTDSDLGNPNSHCLSNRSSSTFNTTGPIVSAALNPYKQEPLALKTHSVEENEQKKHKLCDVGTPHLERILERKHRKEKRERKRKERGKSRTYEHRRSNCTTKILDDDNSVDLDAAGRALEAQLMEDSDNKGTEEATPSTTATHSSDMTNVFRFSECDENSLELDYPCQSQKDGDNVEKSPYTGAKIKEKKKKKKRSKEDKSINNYQRHETLSPSAVVTFPKTTNKLIIDTQTSNTSDNIENLKKSSICKPSPSLPCLIDEDDNDIISRRSQMSIPISISNNRISRDTYNNSSHSESSLKEKHKEQLKNNSSPINKNIEVNIKSCNVEADINQNKLLQNPSNLCKDDVRSDKVDDSFNKTSVKPTSNNSGYTSNNSITPKRKPEIFIPGFDGTLDESISESAVQSISAEFNTLLLHCSVGETKIPVESPPNMCKQIDKFEESKSRVVISQEETESAVSALLGESFGNSTTDYSFNDDSDALDGLNVLGLNDESEQTAQPVASSEGLDEEAALAAKAIENEVRSSAPVNHVEEESEEISKAIQNLRQDDMDIKVETPQSVRDLQIDTDTEDNVEEQENICSIEVSEIITTELLNNNTDGNSTSSKQSVSGSTITDIASEQIMQTPQTSVITKTEVTNLRQIKHEGASNDGSADKDKEHLSHSKSRASEILSTPNTTNFNQQLSQKIHPISMNVSQSTSGSNVSSTTGTYQNSLAPSKSPAYSSTTIEAEFISKRVEDKSKKQMPPMTTAQPPKITIPNLTHFAIPIAISPLGAAVSSHNSESKFSSPCVIQTSPQSVAATHIRNNQEKSVQNSQALSGDNVATLRQEIIEIKTSDSINQAAHQKQQKQLTGVSDDVGGGDNTMKLTSPYDQKQVAHSQQQQHLIKVSNEQGISLPVPVSVQKIPVSVSITLPSHPTIISKVVSLTPQYESHSNIHISSFSNAQQTNNKGVIYSSTSTSENSKCINITTATTTTSQIVQHLINSTPSVPVSSQQTLTNQSMQQKQQQQQQQSQSFMQQQIQQQRGVRQHSNVMHQQHQDQQHAISRRQQNVIQQSSVAPQHYVVQQQVVGLLSPSQRVLNQSIQQMSKPNSPQIRTSPNVQQKTQQQDRQYPCVQTNSQRLIPSKLNEKELLPNISSDVSKVTVTSNQKTSLDFSMSSSPTTTANVRAEIANQGVMNIVENTSVIHSSTPISTVISTSLVSTYVSTTLSKIVTMSPSVKTDDINEKLTQKENNYSHIKKCDSNSFVSPSSTVIKKMESTSGMENKIRNDKTHGEDFHVIEQQESFDDPLKDTGVELLPLPQLKVNVFTSTATINDNSVRLEENTSSEVRRSINNMDNNNDVVDETQKMPTFEEVQINGTSYNRSSMIGNVGSDGLGSTVKRGRQQRGGKKASPSLTPTSTSYVEEVSSPQTEVVSTSVATSIGGVQTRLRKPITLSPVTRGRKGRPPRNLLLQQQQQQQSQTMQQQQHRDGTTPSNNVITSFPTTIQKKARNHITVSAATVTVPVTATTVNNNMICVSDQQDIYEFHDDSGEESKSIVSPPQVQQSSSPGDIRPRLILTIKSPLQNLTSNTNDNDIKSEKPNKKSENVSSTSDLERKNLTMADPLSTEGSPMNTRKSRRLLEKDRSTIDDIIEDVVRNNGTNAIPHIISNTMVSINSSSKEILQMLPRRSGRNSVQSKVKLNTESSPVLSANPIGRPRKLKDSKVGNDLEITQTSTAVIASSDVRETKIKEREDCNTPDSSQQTQQLQQRQTQQQEPQQQEEPQQQQPQQRQSQLQQQSPRQQQLQKEQLQKEQSQKKELQKEQPQKEHQQKEQPQKGQPLKEQPQKDKPQKQQPQQQLQEGQSQQQQMQQQQQQREPHPQQSQQQPPHTQQPQQQQPRLQQSQQQQPRPQQPPQQQPAREQQHQPQQSPTPRLKQQQQNFATANVNQTISTVPQHPKKKALAAVENESFVLASPTRTTSAVTIPSPIPSTATISVIPTNATITYSALPSGGVPIPNTAAPATQKTTGGLAAEATNKCLLDPITGVLSRIQTQQGKEGCLPVSAAAAPPMVSSIIAHGRQSMDGPKISQTIVPTTIDKETTLASTEGIIKNKIMYSSNVQGSSPGTTPITAIIQSAQNEVETNAETPVTSAVSIVTTTSLAATTTMINKSVSVVVKSSIAPPIATSPVSIKQHQNLTNSQQASSVQNVKHSVVIHPQNIISLPSQQQPLNTKVLSGNNLKAHVLNSQKVQQHQPQQHVATTINNPNTLHSINGQQQQQVTIQIQNQTNIATRHPIQQPQHQHHEQAQLQSQSQMNVLSQPKQLLINIPPPSISSPCHIGDNITAPTVCSPHLQQKTFAMHQTSQQQQLQQQQQTHQTVILQKQNQDSIPQVVVSVLGSKTTPTMTTTATTTASVNLCLGKQTMGKMAPQQPTNVTYNLSSSDVSHINPQYQLQQQQEQQQQQMQGKINAKCVLVSGVSSSPLMQNNLQSSPSPLSSPSTLSMPSSGNVVGFASAPVNHGVVQTKVPISKQQSLTTENLPAGSQDSTTVDTCAYLQSTPSPPAQLQQLTITTSTVAAKAEAEAEATSMTAVKLNNSTSNSIMQNISEQNIVPHIMASATSSTSIKQQPLILTNGSNMRTSVPVISPQSQARVGSLLLPTNIQVPSVAHFDASKQDIGNYTNSAGKVGLCGTQSPPPAHQQTTSTHTASDTAAYSGGALRGVPSREHFMIYQQLLRSSQQQQQQQQQDSISSTTVNLREYDESIIDSPPLELRRPGSAPRTTTIGVSHSLQSPQDRTTDSPQAAQVYVHSNRVPTHYNTASVATTVPPGGYFDASRQIAREPPPAHRSAAVHNPVVGGPPSAVTSHPTPGNTSPFIATAPSPTTSMAAVPSTILPNANTILHHTVKLTERERECEHEYDRDAEQFSMQREKEQIIVRNVESHVQQNTPSPTPHPQQIMTHNQPPPGPIPAPHDSLLTLLQRYPVMWQGLLALKTDQAAVQMHFVFGNPHVARASLPCNSDGSTPPLRIAQRMRLEQTQLDGVARKMQFENEHCMLLALPCGRDHADVLQQSRNLQYGFIQYLQQKTAAGIVNIPMPGSEQAAYVVHIFPSCVFANENLERAAPDLKHRVSEINHLLIVIATV